MGKVDKDGVPFAEDRRNYWDERWAAEGDIFGLEPNRFVFEALGDVPPGKVLDLGAGQGRNAVWLATRGHEVTAVDLSSVATDRAEELARRVGVRIHGIATDLGTWKPPSQAFDVVLLSYLHVEPVLRANIHAGAVASVVPGGMLFLVAHHRDNLEHGVGGPQLPELLVDEEALAADFIGLEIERNETVTRPVEGSDVPAIDIVLMARAPAGP